MLELKVREAATAVNGRYTSDGIFSGVFTDTRKPLSGGMFVALEGDRFDGHDYIVKAAECGASVVMCSKKTDVSVPVIYVADTKKALLSLASYYRGLFNVPVIGITGSVGKTTTKDMTALVVGCKFSTVKTQGNLNNDIGMPMTIFTFDESTEAAVIEMGMNHKGEISALTAVARPDIGIITNIGVSHIENLGSRENILSAKLEILEGMQKGSPLIVCGDNDLLANVKNDDYDIFLFGIDNDKCQVKAEDIRMSGTGTNLNVVYEGQKFKMYVPVAGIHNVYNALAAFSAGVSLGIDPIMAAQSLSEYVPTGMRQKTEIKNGIVFIEDCYNASPDSVKASINTLMTIDAKRHIAVLGDMLELGDYSESAHEECGVYAADMGVDMLFICGEKSHYTARAAEEAGMKNVFYYGDPKKLSDNLVDILTIGDAVVFKASRGMKFESIIAEVYKNL